MPSFLLQKHPPGEKPETVANDRMALTDVMPSITGGVVVSAARADATLMMVFTEEEARSLAVQINTAFAKRARRENYNTRTADAIDTSPSVA